MGRGRRSTTGPWGRRRKVSNGSLELEEEGQKRVPGSGKKVNNGSLAWGEGSSAMSFCGLGRREPATGTWNRGRKDSNKPLDCGRRGVRGRRRKVSNEFLESKEGQKRVPGSGEEGQNEYLGRGKKSATDPRVRG